MHAEDETDERVIEFLEVAEEYLAAAGVVEHRFNRARYRLALKAIALHYYDNRDPDEKVPELPRPTRNIVNQLKPYP